MKYFAIRDSATLDYLTPESHSDHPGSFWHPEQERAWLFMDKKDAEKIAASVGASVFEVKE